MFLFFPITDKLYGSFGSDRIHFAKWFRDLLNGKHFPSVIVSHKVEIMDIKPPLQLTDEAYLKVLLLEQKVLQYIPQHMSLFLLRPRAGFYQYDR